jgi:hypothetical protein
LGLLNRSAVEPANPEYLRLLLCLSGKTMSKEQSRENGVKKVPVPTSTLTLALSRQRRISLRLKRAREKDLT